MIAQISEKFLVFVDLLTEITAISLRVKQMASNNPDPASQSMNLKLVLLSI
jgi:hypothetical protein